MKEEKIYDFFKSICSFSDRKLKSMLLKNVEMVASVYESFISIEKKYFEEFPVESNFRKLVDFNYTHLILNNLYTHECFEDYDINDDGGMYDYEENRMGKYNKLAKESLVSKGVYFPSFTHEDDDIDFASYNLDLIKKSFKILETEFEDLIEFSQYHVDFVVKNGLRFEIKSSCYDENLVDGYEEFKIWVYKFSNQWDFKDHNIIEGLDDGMNEVWSRVVEGISDLADREMTDKEGIPFPEYCDDGTQDFNSMKFLDINYNF